MWAVWVLKQYTLYLTPVNVIIPDVEVVVLEHNMATWVQAMLIELSQYSVQW